ncbi:amidohydrolase family protein [Streptomyces sp. NPDC005195]|uniref:amidohydrolase family protein n=1 Tax=Streptomyces sp. NPDC005195 TaxID=3154561 RepID=UPI0033B94885
MAAPGSVRAGVIDVHAHWLPRELLALPPGTVPGGMNDRDGQLFLGDHPLFLATEAMTDIEAVLADTLAAGLGARVLSAPPFAFPVYGPSEADEYITAYNNRLAEAVSSSDGMLAGLGLTRVDDVDAARREMTRLTAMDGIAGVAVPALVQGQSYGEGAMREVLATACGLDLAVLVHPMQLPRPEWTDLYLTNLIGNPVETTTAVASLLLSGVLDELPNLRICFVHGGGCAPTLIGRWQHGWHARADVRQGSTHPPAEGFAKLYFDTVTHDPDVLGLLTARASRERILCGSDYPFDMAQPNPVRFLLDNGLDAATLETNARQFLGIQLPSRGT